MPTQAADPKTQNTLAVEPSERKTSDRVTMPWEYDERRLEKEQAAAVAEAERILFSSTGSMLNEFKPEIQVEDKPVTTQEMQSSNFTNYDLFFKPLEGATNIVGTVIDAAPDIFNAAKDLGKIVLGAETNTEQTPQMTEEKVKKAQDKQFKSFVTQKTGEINAAVSQISMQKKLEEALYIIGTPTSQDAAAELGMNPDLDQKHITDKYHAVLLATKQSEKINKALKEKEHQEAAEVQTPEIVADLEGGVEGGTGRGTHIMSMAGGGE